MDPAWKPCKQHVLTQRRYARREDENLGFFKLTNCIGRHACCLNVSIRCAIVHLQSKRLKGHRQVYFLSHGRPLRRTVDVSFLEALKGDRHLFMLGRHPVYFSTCSPAVQSDLLRQFLQPLQQASLSQSIEALLQSSLFRFLVQYLSQYLPVHLQSMMF